VEREEDTVNIDMSNIFDHDLDLYAKIVRYLLDIILLLDTECQEVAIDIRLVRFGALEEVFMSYRPHGAWRTMEVLEELA
jgi:hypothetical protein